MYTLFPTKAFLRKAKKILNSQNLQKNFGNTLKLLENSPFSTTLSTHKVQSKKHGIMYSSKITGDIRIIWNFDEDNKLVLLLFDIGGHEGKNKVYK